VLFVSGSQAFDWESGGVGGEREGGEAGEEGKETKGTIVSGKDEGNTEDGTESVVQVEACTIDICVKDLHSANAVNLQIPINSLILESKSLRHTLASPHFT
jgi:hypothetical protein